MKLKPDKPSPTFAAWLDGVTSELLERRDSVLDRSDGSWDDGFVAGMDRAATVVNTSPPPRSSAVEKVMEMGYVTQQGPAPWEVLYGGIVRRYTMLGQQDDMEDPRPTPKQKRLIRAICEEVTRHPHYGDHECINGDGQTACPNCPGGH